MIRGSKALLKCILCMLLILCLSGCKSDSKEQTDVVLTTDFGENEIFRIEDKHCFTKEAEVYMNASGGRYQSVFGDGIWSRNLGGTSLAKELKSMTLARLAQIKAMNLLAESRNLELDEGELEKVKKAAKHYLESIPEKERASFEEDNLIESMYAEYALSEKVYHEITKDVNPEISDDEARTITVQHILIKTYSLNEDGTKREYSDKDRQAAYSRAEKALKAVHEGEDFGHLIDLYSEDSENSYTFGKGVMPESFEKAAFNLGTGEISDIVETEYGYHIIECVSTFDEAETDLNKERIVRERKLQEFNRVYESFVKTLHSYLNEPLWDSLQYKDAKNAGNTDFFAIYDEVFS